MKRYHIHDNILKQNLHAYKHGQLGKTEDYIMVKEFEIQNFIIWIPKIISLSHPFYHMLIS
jgi:hypothetical protein